MTVAHWEEDGRRFDVRAADLCAAEIDQRLMHRARPPDCRRPDAENRTLTCQVDQYIVKIRKTARRAGAQRCVGERREASECQGSSNHRTWNPVKRLKSLKRAMRRPCGELAWIWGWRHGHSGSAWLSATTMNALCALIVSESVHRQRARAEAAVHVASIARPRANRATRSRSLRIIKFTCARASLKAKTS